MAEDSWQTSDVSDFDFDRSALESWRRFADRLAEVLSVMDAGATLSIGALVTDGGGTQPYLRFSCLDGGRLVGDARTDDGVGPDAGVRLSGAGWQPNAAGWGSHRMEGSQDAPDRLATAASDALREVYGVQHPALLAPDELADILVPAPTESDGAVTGAVEGADPELARTFAELSATVDRELASYLGHVPLRDDEGDLALRVGSTMVFVRPSPDAQEVLVFAPLVHEVEGRSRAMEVLSDLNTEARWVRFLLIRDRVYVSMSVMAAPLVPDHLHRALRIVSLVGDSIDEALAQKLRGRTTFAEDADGSG
ncbi:MAG: T3SS (YopN, CesT) and YbjN peptide-binding chaperone 1 [Actinomycetes bacterium]